MLQLQAAGCGRHQMTEAASVDDNKGIVSNLRINNQSITNSNQQL
jgi:hypothetical protein